MRRRRFALGIALAFSAILLSYLVYTTRIANTLRRDAGSYSRIYFRVVQSAVSQDGLSFESMLELLDELYKIEIPVVLTDVQGLPNDARNLPFEADLSDPAGQERVREYVARLDARSIPLVDSTLNLVVHYGEPVSLRRLKWIPWLQAALLLGVLLLGWWVVREASRGERERLWTAMARESAHQMGTPLSSLSGWLELAAGPEGLAGAEDVDVLAEMEADVGRLRKVSRRFELIGLAPELGRVDLAPILEGLQSYFSARLPSLASRVRLNLDLPPEGPVLRGSSTLLEWGFENLIKNALDSLAGREGEIRIAYVGLENNRAVLRVSDDGPGVPLEVRDRLFDVGVTTKEGGWGVGLSLTRRIFVEMHGGDIQLESTPGGASFRIELPLVGAA
ncbi:MAG: HAMP domain-containing sensor histidine kinase [Gemmatimonadota bacterium]